MTSIDLIFKILMCVFIVIDCIQYIRAKDRLEGIDAMLQACFAALVLIIINQT